MVFTDSIISIVEPADESHHTKYQRGTKTSCHEFPPFELNFVKGELLVLQIYGRCYSFERREYAIFLTYNHIVPLTGLCHE